MVACSLSSSRCQGDRQVSDHLVVIRLAVPPPSIRLSCSFHLHVAVLAGQSSTVNQPGNPLFDGAAKACLAASQLVGDPPAHVQEPGRVAWAPGGGVAGARDEDRDAWWGVRQKPGGHVPRDIQGGGLDKIRHVVRYEEEGEHDADPGAPVCCIVAQLMSRVVDISKGAYKPPTHYRPIVLQTPPPSPHP